jgi:GNAT superfamily N-acetyltransferase
MHHPVTLREAEDSDREFLYQVYASTRREEMAVASWPPETLDAFLRDQFRLQDIHYRKFYPQARFQVVLVDDEPAGRLYVQALAESMRLLDIALLPAFRGKGIGDSLLRGLLAVADARALPMSLNVEFNNPIRAYYKRLGFKESPVDGVYLFMERLPKSKAAA